MKEVDLKRYDSLILKTMHVSGRKGIRSVSKARRKLGMVWKNNDRYPNIKYYFINRFNDLTYMERNASNIPVAEVVYRLVNGIETNPVCPVCGKPVPYTNEYKKYCSQKCRTASSEWRDSISSVKRSYTKERLAEIDNKRRKTNLRKHGIENYVNTEKKIKTNLERYGETNYAKTKDWKDHYRKWWQSLPEEEREMRMKYIQDGNKKYFADEENRKRHSETLKRFNDNMSREYYEWRCINTKAAMNSIPDEKKREMTRKKIETMKSWTKEFIAEIQKKRHETQKINHTCLGPTSNMEKYTIERFKETFNDVIAHYHDRRYANEYGRTYECDIYVPSKDAFIECQYYYTHHPVKHKFSGFDINIPEDREFYNKFHNKCNDAGKKIYITYFVSDPEKRQVAKRNGLNFYEIWQCKDDEIDYVIDQIKNQKDVS